MNLLVLQSSLSQQNDSGRLFNFEKTKTFSSSLERPIKERSQSSYNKNLDQMFSKKEKESVFYFFLPKSRCSPQKKGLHFDFISNFPVLPPKSQCSLKKKSSPRIDFVFPTAKQRKCRKVSLPRT